MIRVLKKYIFYIHCKQALLSSYLIIDCEGESSKRREIIDGEGVDKIKEIFENKTTFSNTLYLRLIRIIKLWTMLCFHTLIILSRHGNDSLTRAPTGWSMEVELLALLENYDRPTNRSTDGHEGS